MYETTFIETTNHDEIMVDWNADNNKLIQVYCYAKDIPVIVNAKEEEREVRTYPMINSAFKRIHLGDFKKYIEQNNIVTTTMDCDDEEDDQERTDEYNESLSQMVTEHFPTVEILD